MTISSPHPTLTIMLSLSKCLLASTMAIAFGLPALQAETVYFLAGGATLESAPRSQAYVVPVSDPAMIAQARQILADRPNRYASTNWRLRVRIAAGADGLNKNFFSPDRTVWNWHATEFIRFVFVDYGASGPGGPGTGDPTAPPDLPERSYSASPRDISENAAGFIAQYGDVIELWGYSLMAEINPTAPSSAVLNVSTRGRTGPGEDRMIAGIVVANGPPKNVLIRVVGPTLANFGVANVLADPKLELFVGSAKVDENDNWQNSARAAEINALTTLRPTDPREPAILVALFPGAYTIQVSGASNSSGICLIEVYDLDPR